MGSKPKPSSKIISNSTTPSKSSEVYHPSDDVLSLQELKLKLKDNKRLFFVKLRVYGNKWVHHVSSYAELDQNGTATIVGDQE